MKLVSRFMVFNRQGCRPLKLNFHMTRAQCSIEVDPGKSFTNCNIRAITLSKNHAILISLLANMPQWNWSTKRFRAEKKYLRNHRLVSEGLTWVFEILLCLQTEYRNSSHFSLLLEGKTFTPGNL